MKCRYIKLCGRKANDIIKLWPGHKCYVQMGDFLFEEIAVIVVY